MQFACDAGPSRVYALMIAVWEVEAVRSQLIRVGLVLSVIGGWGGPGLHADTVELKNKLKLEGTVWLDKPEYPFVILMVDDNRGQIRIPRDKIQHIEIDVKNIKVDPDDFAGKYKKVGLVAMEKGKYAEAIEVFEGLKGKEGPGPDLLKQLGKAYEQRQQFGKALENYTEYLKTHPEDTAVVEEVNKLKKQTADTEPDAVKPTKNVNGLEATGIWTDEKWDKSNAVKVQLIPDPTDAGRKIRVAQSDGGPGEKVAFSRTEQNLNVATAKQLSFRAYLKSEAKAINVAVAFINAQGEYYESKPMRIPSGSWSDQAVPLDAKTFKSAKTGWKFESELGGRESISRMVFVVPGQTGASQPAFTLYIDSLFFK